MDVLDVLNASNNQLYVQKFNAKLLIASMERNQHFCRMDVVVVTDAENCQSVHWLSVQALNVVMERFRQSWKMDALDVADAESYQNVRK